MLAVYLLSAQAGFVAGQHVEGDGGMTVKMPYLCADTDPWLRRRHA